MAMRTGRLLTEFCLRCPERCPEIIHVTKRKEVTSQSKMKLGVTQNEKRNKTQMEESLPACLLSSEAKKKRKNKGMPMDTRGREECKWHLDPMQFQGNVDFILQTTIALLWVSTITFRFECKSFAVSHTLVLI